MAWVSNRSEVLELAILGQLRDGPQHGYALRKHLNATLGPFRALSYGSLYPTLKSLAQRELIATTDTGELAHALASKRTRVLYRLTPAGQTHLAQTLSTAAPQAWDDHSFDVHFSLFDDVEPAQRLWILEGRRTRVLEQREALRAQQQATRERRNSYTAELHRHGLDQLDREVRWLEDLIHAERSGTTAPPRSPQ